MCLNLFFKKYCCGLVEGVDLIFRIVCQISGQDTVTQVTNPKIILAFSDLEVLFLCYCCFNRSKRLPSKYLF